MTVTINTVKGIYSICYFLLCSSNNAFTFSCNTSILVCILANTMTRVMNPNNMGHAALIISRKESSLIVIVFIKHEIHFPSISWLVLFSFFGGGCYLRNRPMAAMGSYIAPQDPDTTLPYHSELHGAWPILYYAPGLHHRIDLTIYHALDSLPCC